MQEIVNLDKLEKTIVAAENILVVVGNNYSADELAAGLGLGLSLEKAGKKVTVFSQKPPLVEEASLFGISKVTNRLDSNKLIISIANALDSVDKVTHYLEGQTLNIVVHPVAATTNLSTDKVSLSQQQRLADLIILVNTTSEQFHSAINPEEQQTYAKVPKFVIGKKIDRLEQEETIVSTVENTSLSETVVWILTKLGLSMDGDCASNLFQGMKSATGFMPPGAGVSTFEAAAICLQNKPVFPDLRQHLPSSQPYQNTQAFTQQTKDQRPIQEEARNSDVFQPSNLKSAKPGDFSQDEPEEENGATVKSDWLGPKIFKSSDKPDKI